MILKPIIRFVIFVMMLGICFSCKTKHSYPQDFAFKIESNTELINSFDSTYTRSYLQGDSIVKIQFSSAELKLIYNSIIKNGLDRYPDNYSPTCEFYTMPSFEAKFQFRINGEYKNLTNLKFS